MPTVNRQSVRDELNRLKSEFKQLNRANKITPESRVLMNGLFILLELIVSVFLEKVTKKTSRNSSLPPSQTEKDESSRDKTKHKNKKSQQSTTLPNTRTIETTEVVSVQECPHCGASLEDVLCTCHERRTRIDIVFEKTVEHVDAEVKTCPSCHHTAKGKFPKDMAGPRQYGYGIKAYVIHLLITQMISLKRAQTMLTNLIGEVIAEATQLKWILRLHQQLERWEITTKQNLLKLAYMHVDETSLRINKKNHWIHVYSSREITLKLLHKKRGKEAMEAFDIIPRYGGVLVHDCWSSYLSYKHCSHGLCGSHLLRELTFIIDSNNYAWAKNMKRLLKESCHIVSQCEEKCLSEKAYANLQKRYRNILTRGEKELPKIVMVANKKRGRIAKSDAHNLWERLKIYEQEILLFAKLSFVPFTNNRAEQDLRMSKVKQKVSGCFRGEKYAHAYCRISSYLQTMNNKGINPLIAIQMALSGEIYNRRGE